MRNTSLTSLARTAVVACLLALFSGGPALAQDDDDAAVGSEAWFAKVNAQNHGIRTQWSGSVRGDINKAIQGQARLNFVEVDGGRLSVSLWLGETHTFYSGVGIHGIVSCARGTRTYPAWVQRRPYEQRPAGQLEVRYTDPDAIVSRRAGRSSPNLRDSYTAEQGKVTLTLLEDRLELQVRALVDSGLMRFDKPPYETRARALLTARASVERTLENEQLFDTSRCEGRAPFEVVSIEPGDGRANVLEDRPEILVEMSEDVHPESLENPDLIVVRTLRQAPEQQPLTSEYAPLAGQTQDQPWTPAPPVMGEHDRLEERVSGTIDLKDPGTLRFIPDAPLRPGVRYQIDVAHGDDGVRSKQFHVIQERAPSWFTTRVRPDEIRMHVYQTTRDAPLLQRKPAMARVYVNWTRYTDIHPDWQVEEAEFDIELTKDDSRRAVLPVDTHWVQRPDLYDDEDRRMARDSVNRFGWTPRGTDVKRLVARVRPHDHWPKDREAPEDEGVRQVDYVASQVDDLTVEAYIVRMADWRFELPPSATTAQVVQAFNLDNEFARQVFPVVNVRGRFAGFFEPVFVKPSTDGAYLGSLAPVLEDWDALRENYRSLVVQSKLLHDQVARHSTADIVVGFYPPAFSDGQGKGILGDPGLKANVVLMPVKGVDGSDSPAILNLPLVSHEYGHIFGLPHVPYVANSQERLAACRSGPYYQSSDGIEGFRIASGGGHGWSKSSTTGNGQNADTLKDLMFPCQYDGRWMWWINDVHYKMLARTLPGILQTQRGWRFASQLPKAAVDVAHAVQMQRDLPVAPDGVRRMLVSGFTDGQATLFLPVVDVPSAETGPEPDAPYTVVVEAADGAQLASRRVEQLLEDGAQGPGYFSTALEVQGEPARVLLLRAGEPIGELAAGAAPQAPRILSHEGGAMLRTDDVLRWQPVPGGEAILYSVRYRAAPDGPVRVLAALTDKTELALDPALLPPGDEPSIEVVAHSGLHEARTRLRVRLPDELRPLLVMPQGETTATGEAGIGAWFNAGLAPDSVRDGMVRLVAADGTVVPVQLRADGNASGVQVIPGAELEPGAQYTVHLAPGLTATDGRVMRSAVRWSFQAPARDAETVARGANIADGMPLPRPVEPLGTPFGTGDAGRQGAGVADRATGEVNLIGNGGQRTVPVDFRACRELADTGAGVLLEGGFEAGEGGGRFQVVRVAGDELALIVELEATADRGRVSGRFQGSPDRPGEGGLVLRETAGHWDIIAMLDHDGGRIPFFLTVDCGLN